MQNIVHILVDPDGGASQRHHWIQTGIALLTGAMLHMLYVEPAKTLRGLIGLLSDPESKILETLERMHDCGT